MVGRRPIFQHPLRAQIISQTVCLNYRVSRRYRLGRRQASVDRTARNILAAARGQLEQGAGLRIGAVAEAAGVTRATVYNRFRSRAGLLSSLAPPVAAAPPDLHGYLAARCAGWAASPSLYRHLPDTDDSDATRRLAEDLASADALRPGCSIREAQDVIAVLGSFATFDRLHQDGRRSPAAVTDMLMRLARGILA